MEMKRWRTVVQTDKHSKFGGYNITPPLFVWRGIKSDKEFNVLEFERKKIEEIKEYPKTGNFHVVQFSWNLAVSINPRKLKYVKHFYIFEKLVFKN